jgi:hypothetical protein
MAEGVGRRCALGEPFVLPGGAADLVQPVAGEAAWSLAGLGRGLGGAECTILHSARGRFPYYDAEQLAPAHDALELPTTFTGTVADFQQQVATAMVLRRGAGQWYLQKGHPVNSNSPADAGVEWAAVDWAWVEAVQVAAGMGAMTSVQLFASSGGTTSPLHYDQLHNLFLQLAGAKRFTLFPPAAAPYLLPHPVGHPLDRRSQLDLRCDAGWIDRAARGAGLGTVAGRRTVLLQPGDLLYLPPFWWHEVSSEVSSDACEAAENISMAVWMDGVAPDPREACARSSCTGVHGRDGVVVGVGRNLEAAVCERLAALMGCGVGTPRVHSAAAAALRQMAALMEGDTQSALAQPQPQPQQHHDDPIAQAAAELHRSLGPAVRGLFGGSRTEAAGWLRLLVFGGRLEEGAGRGDSATAAAAMAGDGCSAVAATGIAAPRHEAQQ